MTEDYKPTDNAIAERVNGILKTEVIYRERRFKTYQDALERISGFIAFYNDTRPHSSIGMKTPSEAHQEQGPQRIMWKPAGTLSGAVCPLPQGTPRVFFIAWAAHRGSKPIQYKVNKKR